MVRDIRDGVKAMRDDLNAVQARLLESVEMQRSSLIGLLQRLIQARSITGSEAPASDVCAAQMRALGMEVDQWDIDADQLRAHPGSNPSSFPYAGRPNAVGVYRGADPARGRSLILNGHIDVVTPEPLAGWSHDPWGGDVADGRVYGRGAVDMKGGIAAMIVALEAVLASGLRPLGDVLVECVIEEEEGVGNGTLGSLLRGYTADACVVTEGTDLQVHPGMRGAIRWQIAVVGRSAHGVEKWKGVDAIEKGLQVWQSLRYFESAVSLSHTHPLYADCPINIPVTPDAIQAGAWRGMVAPVCTIDGYLETLPGRDTYFWEKQFQAYLASIATTDPWLCDHVPQLIVSERYEAYAENEDDPFVRLIQAATNRVTGTSAPLRGMNAGCDAVIRHLYGGCPTVIFGPTGGNAHSADEYVDVDSLVETAKVLALTIAGWCGVA